MLQIQDLSVTYPNAGTVLSSVSLSVRRGELLVLLGRSGAGKSSLLRALNYLVRPSQGSITVADIGTLGDRRSLAAHRRQTGMVFQQHQLILRITALDNVLLGCIGRYSTWHIGLPFSRSDVELAYRCLDRVGLSHHALRRADELSGGERQRVGIARALAQQPQLLLVDEPVASLDPQTSEQIMALLKEIQRAQRLTAIVNLHQLDLARRYADRIVGLAGGRIVFDGTPGELAADNLVRIYGASLARAEGSAASPEPASTETTAESFEHEMMVQDD